jgi:hypothetical protein
MFAAMYQLYMVCSHWQVFFADSRDELAARLEKILLGDEDRPRWPIWAVMPFKPAAATTGRGA